METSLLEISEVRLLINPTHHQSLNIRYNILFLGYFRSSYGADEA